MKHTLITNDKDLRDLWSTIVWLDECRWKNENELGLPKYPQKNITNSEKILAHWLWYVTNYQMPAKIVWEKGFPIFSLLAYGYSRSNSEPSNILSDRFEQYQGKDKKTHYRFKSDNGESFASRFPQKDHKLIKHTLEVLNAPEYCRNLIRFIMSILMKFKEEDDLIQRIACALRLLTYESMSKEEVIAVLNNPNQFNENLAKFKKKATEGKKRLWCALRDYKKGPFHNIFVEAIKEIQETGTKSIIESWNALPMNQIELPGDLWNNSPFLKANLLAKVLDLNTIPKSWNMPRLLRNLYTTLADKGQANGLYPEQFDITVDFVPRMCEKKLCRVCPFGPNGSDDLCDPKKGRYCAVALICCGYFARCDGDKTKCPICNGISKNICKQAFPQDS